MSQAAAVASRLRRSAEAYKRLRCCVECSWSPGAQPSSSGDSAALAYSYPQRLHAAPSRSYSDNRGGRVNIFDTDVKRAHRDRIARKGLQAGDKLQQQISVSLPSRHREHNCLLLRFSSTILYSSSHGAPCR